MNQPLFISSYFLDYILPFVLVFTLIFAILEKTKLLGEDKKQVNAIIGLVIGLILIGTPFARDIVVKLMPFLAIFAVILLVFMLLYGFIEGKKEADVLPWGLKITFGILLAIALVMVLLFITGWWDNLFQSTSGSRLLINGIVIVAIVAVVIFVVMGEKGEKE
jgi:hypothetical protein